MQSKGNEPTKAQKDWREEVRALGCIVSMEKGPHIQIHHVLGATAKHNKVEIGHWFILPLTGWYHLEAPVINATNHKKMFEAQFGSQASLFNQLLRNYEFHYEKPVPVPQEVLAAIYDLDRCSPVNSY